jgi:TMEM175 potassium channel family protein
MRTGRAAGFPRGSEEFSRVLAFSDGLFAIAMTLLVVGIGVPELTDGKDEGELLDAFGDLIAEVISFFISFAVIGRYWVAHHQFFALLRAMDYPLVAINLVYLAFIAFLPFPTGLLGSYFENPISVATYALAVAIVSGLEVLLFWHAYRAGLLVREMPEPVFRWGVMSSSLPVAFFVISVPVAFLSTYLAVAVWFLPVPLQVVRDRRRPAEAASWF